MLTACTPESVPGPSLGIKYGKPLTFLSPDYSERGAITFFYTGSPVSHGKIQSKHVKWHRPRRLARSMRLVEVQLKTTHIEHVFSHAGIILQND